MTNVQPVYPNGILSWTDRVDQVDVDFANDINTVASDLISVEKTLGENPEIETGLPNGLPDSVIYGNVSERISDAMKNAQLPYGSLITTGEKFTTGKFGQFNHLHQEWDPYNMWNGTDFTVPCDGWWQVDAGQTWPWDSSGYGYIMLIVNGLGNILGDDLIDWGFSGNTSVFFGPNRPPNWQVGGLRPRRAQCTWQGRLHKHDRLSLVSENGTSNTTVATINTTLRMHCFRNID